MNETLNSLKYLSGKFDVIVTETNDIEFREDIYDIDITESQDQEVSFFMRTKLRRVIQKKGNDQDEYGGGIGEQTMLSSKFSDNFGRTGDPATSNMVGGSPYLWIKIDPYNHFLKKIIIREGENILIAQMEKDMRDQGDIFNIYRLLDGLKGCPSVQVVNKLISYVTIKD